MTFHGHSMLTKSPLNFVFGIETGRCMPSDTVWPLIGTMSRVGAAACSLLRYQLSLFQPSKPRALRKAVQSRVHSD